MSFVDLATLALHRRNEMEARIKVLTTKCDQATNDIARLKLHAKNFVQQLNCEPSELKERFLHCMKQLDEYIYLLTDFNLSIDNLGMTGNIEAAPVHDTLLKPVQIPLPAFNFNIIDTLSEPTPSTSTACSNLCPVEKPRRKKVFKEEQSLIVFSSASCSSESVPARSDRAEKHVQCELTSDQDKIATALDKMTLTDGPTSSSTPLGPSPSANRLGPTDRGKKHNQRPSASDEPIQDPNTSEDSTDKPTTTNGPTLSLNRPTSSNDPAPSSNGLASSSNGPAPSSNGLASSSNGPTSSPDSPTTFDVAGCAEVNLPAQTVLQTEQVYQALIMNVDGASIWIITADANEVYNLIAEMTSYCKENRVKLSPEDIKSLTYCAFYDEEGEYYYRALFIRLVEDQIGVAEVFLVDTGEVRCGSLACLQPLPAAFCARPPYARCAHLAGVELAADSEQAVAQYEEFLKQYVGAPCSIEVDDNTSESLGVYVLVGSEWLHEALVSLKLARPLEDKVTPARSIRNTECNLTPSAGPPELIRSEELDLNCPEYDDPVEAVTGHKYRDEIDICKHYKGGPERTCFKGARCTKRHVLKHPDGWTLDQVPAAAPRAAALPAPGTWQRARVTCVAHFDRLYVHFLDDDDRSRQEELPSFGVVLPPTTLDALVRDMNSPATRLTYKPLKITPAPGELVAALYPLDDQWYRARVLTATRADQNVEVMYIDYGNVVWVKEDAVCELSPRYAALPAQAARCALAGAAARGHDSRLWAQAKRALAAAALDRTLHAHVIARDYDEVTIELFDEDGYSIAEQLAAQDLITLKEYSVIDDSDVKQKITVP